MRKINILFYMGDGSITSGLTYVYYLVDELYHGYSIYL